MLDNDNDGMTDGMDGKCFEYPFEDGNGESNPTEPNDRYNSRSYVSLFEYHRDYSAMGDPIATLQNVCMAAQIGLYDNVEGDTEKATQYVNENGGCEGSGP